MERGERVCSLKRVCSLYSECRECELCTVTAQRVQWIDSVQSVQSAKSEKNVQMYTVCVEFVESMRVC